MPRSPATASKDSRFSLKQLAEHLGLAPATVSLVLNGSHVAKTISPETRARIIEAARRFKYRPNFLARSLRTRRSFTIGVMVPEVSEGYNAAVLSGIEDALVREGYFYFVASHHFRPDLVDEYVDLFLDRSVDGLIVVNTPWSRELKIPVVTVSSHHSVPGVTSILLDHHCAARAALTHLSQLGHRRVAYIKGQALIPDTRIRWNAIEEAARELNLEIDPELVIQLEGDSPKPDPGYQATQKLLASKQEFTALFAFNDISALGAILALHQAGVRVPEEISVVGFDDIEGAGYQNPGLTTVRQPLRKMGVLSAETVLQRITLEGDPSSRIVVDPELIVRGTTSKARAASMATAELCHEA